MAYTKYSLTPANNNAAPPDGAPEGMLPSAVNDTMRDMMAQIRDVGDGIRGGTYTMTAPVITGGSVTGVALSGNTFTNPVISGGSINNTTIGATTASTGAFSTLSATGNVSFDGGSFVFNETGADKDARFEGDTDANLLFLDASTDRIGIGTSSPAQKLQVVGTLSSLGGSITANMSSDGSNGVYETNGACFLRSTTSNPVIFGTNNTERMRIDSSGNVGIGQTAPTANLHIRNTSGNATLKLEFGTGGTQSNIIGASSEMSLQVAGASAMTFYTNSAERMRIDSSGNLFVGTTSNTTINTGVAVIKDPGEILIGHPTGTVSTWGYLGFRYANTTIGSVTQSGTTAVLYNLTSDLRLKTNIVDCPTGNIDDVKVRSFDWKSDGSHVEYGFIAQELVEVAPYAVHQPQDPEEMMAVDYSKLVPMMIKEIQDLKQRIKTLENK